MKQAGHGLLVVDGGDTFLGPRAANGTLAPADRARASVMMQAHQAMGMHALAPGDADLPLGLDTLKELSESSKVPLLGANVRDAAGQPIFERRRLISTGGIKVGLTAILDPPPSTSTTKFLEGAGVVLADPQKVAQEELSALLTEGAEVAILLFHGGVPRARELLQKVKGFHLVLVGHSGYRLNTPTRVGDTYVMEAGRRGQELGHVELRLGDGWSREEALTDDSRRFVLYQQIQGELQAAKKPSPRRKHAPRGRDPQEARLKRIQTLIGQLAEVQTPKAKHTLVATTIPLDETVSDHQATKSLVQSTRASWQSPRPNLAPRAVRRKQAVQSPRGVVVGRPEANKPPRPEVNKPPGPPQIKTTR